jgi:hypothetical protein
MAGHLGCKGFHAHAQLNAWFASGEQENVLSIAITQQVKEEISKLTS